MPYSVYGLPLHPLVVHVTVALIPALGITLLVAALVPRTRRYLRWPSAVAAVLAVPVVMVTMDAGDHLESQLPASAAIQNHANMADQLLPFVLALAVVAIVFLIFTSDRVRFSGVNVATWIVAGIAVILAAGSVVQVVRIGDSGATAAWEGVGNLPVRTGG